MMGAETISVLIADDDPCARDLLSHQLDGNKFSLEMHPCAEDALKALNQKPKYFDVVLLDHHMPGGMSGLDCLKAIKAAPKFKHLPVILQTSENDVGIISEALSCGAYYFLEKATEKKLIQSVVQSAMEYKLRFQEIENERNALKNGLQFVEEARFRIRTLSEMNMLTGLLSTAYPDKDRVMVGIHELLTNAIEHGNLSITYEGKSQLIMDNKWASEIDFRLNLPENKKKTVEILLQKTASKITLTIIDQGNGFNCENFLEIDPCRLFDPHGRGIAVAKSLSFDDLEYIGCGNTVVATVFL